MKIFVFDGTWSYYWFDPVTLLQLEFITIVVELLILGLFNRERPKEKRWNFFELGVCVFFANLISFFVGFVALLLWRFIF